MAVTTKTLNSATVYYDDSYTQRWFDAFGENVIKYNLSAGTPTDDTTGDPTAFTMTVTEAGTGDTTCVNSTTAGQALLITTAQNEYDGINLQVKGSAFSVTSGDYLYFRCKASISDATQSDFLCGLCVTKTDNINTSASHAVTSTNVEGMFFFKVDGGTTITAKMYKDGSQIGTADYVTAMDTSAHDYEIYCDGSTAWFYIDNVLVTSFAANLPDTALTPTLCYANGAAGADTVNVQVLTAIQLR